jgi:hypothetical protein
MFGDSKSSTRTEQYYYRLHHCHILIMIVYFFKIIPRVERVNRIFRKSSSITRNVLRNVAQQGKLGGKEGCLFAGFSRFQVETMLWEASLNVQLLNIEPLVKMIPRIVTLLYRPQPG